MSDDCEFAGYCVGDTVMANRKEEYDGYTMKKGEKFTIVKYDKEKDYDDRGFIWPTVKAENGKTIRVPSLYLCIKGEKTVGEECQTDCSLLNTDDKKYKPDGFGGCTRKGTASSTGEKWDSKINGWKITHPIKYKNFMFQGLKEEQEECNKKLLASECKFGMSCRDGYCQKPQTKKERREECINLDEATKGMLKEDRRNAPRNLRKMMWRLSKCVRAPPASKYASDKEMPLYVQYLKNKIKYEKEQKAKKDAKKNEEERLERDKRHIFRGVLSGGKTRRKKRRRKRTKKKRRRKRTKKKRRRRRKRTRRRK